jgi:predicted nucleic-acid-binding Zn-ribbon protein
MAAGAWQLFRRAKLKLASGTFDLDTQTFKMAICTNVQALTDDFAGASTDCRYADLTAEVVGAGYTAGGKTLTPAWTRSGATVTFDVDDQAWTSSTLTDCKYAVIYADNTNDDLLCFCELDTVTNVSMVSGTLTVTINASGVFTLA